MSISEARGRLPEIARFLAAHPDRVVLVEHRDLPETIALVAASHLRLLETQVQQMKMRSGGSRFKLAGSITSKLSDDAQDRALAQMRAAQTKEDERRLREFES